MVLSWHRTFDDSLGRLSLVESLLASLCHLRECLCERGILEDLAGAWRVRAPVILDEQLMAIRRVASQTAVAPSPLVRSELRDRISAKPLSAMGLWVR